MGICLNVVNEAYFGRTKDVKVIEEAISIARKPYLGKKYCGNFYNDKNIAAVGTAIKKAFKFPAVDFNLSNDPSRNAFCYPVGTSMFSSGYLQEVNIDKNGKISFKGNGGEFYCYIRCTTGLWGDSNFTDREITAIILHEIGHVVQHTLGTGMQQYCSSMIIAEFITCIFNPALVISYGINDPTLKGVINKAAKESAVLSALVKGGSSLSGIAKMVMYNFIAFINILAPVTAPLSSIGTTIANAIINPANAIFSIITNTGKKGAEYSADSFATAFGYGADLSSALTKMEYSLDKMTGTRIEKFGNSIPIIRSISDFMNIPCAIITSPFEAHPITPKRINNVIKSLETELAKSDMSPELKKEIKKSIEDMKDLEKKYSKIDNNNRKHTRAWLASVIRSGKGANGVTADLSNHDILDSLVDESAVNLALEKYDSDLYIRLESVILI